MENRAFNREAEAGTPVPIEALAPDAEAEQGSDPTVDDFERWLDCRRQEPRDVAYLLAPAEDGFFEAIPVSDKVNKVANAGPDIQEPVSPGIGHNSGTSQKPAAEKNTSKDDSQFDLF